MADKIDVFPTGLSMWTSVGSVKQRASYYVTGVEMQAASGAVTHRLGQRIAVTGQEMQVGLGQISVKLGPYLHVSGFEMRVETATPRVLGRMFREGYAYPYAGPASFSYGMTLRQWYAGMALQGFISNSVAANLIGTLPVYCFKLADSMIEYEAKQLGPPPITAVPVPPALTGVATPPQQAPITVSDEEVAALRKKDAA